MSYHQEPFHKQPSSNLKKEGGGCIDRGAAQVQGGTLVVSGDGRYWNPEAIQIIIKSLACEFGSRLQSVLPDSETFPMPWHSGSRAVSRILVEGPTKYTEKVNLFMYLHGTVCLCVELPGSAGASLAALLSQGSLFFS